MKSLFLFQDMKRTYSGYMYERIRVYKTNLAVYTNISKKLCCLF